MPDGRRPLARVSLGDRLRAFLDPPATAEMGRPQPDPGPPIPAVMPEESLPRTWVPRSGRNLSAKPRGEGDSDHAAFDLLWRLANQGPLVQIAIADVVNQVSGMDWTVRLKPDFKGQEDRFKSEFELARAWLKMPFPLKQRRFRPWLRRVLREVLVTDALSLVPRKDRAGRPIGLQQISGQTIKPIVDATGEPPDPPATAFQQWVEGRPETNYRLGELWYLPMNPRPDSPYGMSPTEMVLLTINWAMRGDLFDLAYYTTGTIPDSICSLPGFTAKQVADWQDWWDRSLEGNDDARAGGTKFVPGPQTGGALNWQATRQATWSYEQKEWGARVIAWAFGVSPMPIAKMMNRSTSETMEISSLEAGPRPVASFLSESVFTPYLEWALQTDALEIAPAEDETEDSAITIERHRMLVAVGGMTRNELREANGLEPESDSNADRPFVITGSGVTYLDEIDREPDDPKPLTSPQGGDAGLDAPGRPDDQGEMRSDLERWQKVALKSAKAGEPVPAFKSAAIPQSVQRLVRARLQKALTAAEVLKVFDRPFALSKAAAARRARPTFQPSTSRAGNSLASSSAG